MIESVSSTVADRVWNHFGSDSGVADYHKTSKYTDHQGLEEGIGVLCLAVKWTKGEYKDLCSLCLAGKMVEEVLHFQKQWKIPVGN